MRHEGLKAMRRPFAQILLMITPEVLWSGSVTEGISERAHRHGASRQEDVVYPGRRRPEKCRVERFSARSRLQVRKRQTWEAKGPILAAMKDFTSSPLKDYAY